MRSSLVLVPSCRVGTGVPVSAVLTKRRSFFATRCVDLWIRQFAVIPIVVGVALACCGEMEVTIVSFLVTCGCVVLAALKVVVSGEMLTGTMKVRELPTGMACRR